MKFTIEELEAHLAEVVERLKSLDAEYADQPLPDVARDEWDRLREERKATEARIREQKERKAYLAGIEGDDRHEEKGVEERYSFSTRTKQSPFDLEQYRGDARDPGAVGRAMKDGAKRAVEVVSSLHVDRRASISREDQQAHLEHLIDNVDDEHGTLARRILVTGSPTYFRAFGKSLTRKPLTIEEQRALELGQGDEGGYAVPVQLDPSVILTSGGVINPLRAIARVEQIVGKEWQGVTSAGITVSRAAEEAQATDDSPTLAQPTVSAEKVHGFVPFSIELGQDWGGLASEITRMLADARETEEADSFVNGDGLTPNANGLVATLDAASYVLSGATSFASADVYLVEEDLEPRFRAVARWLANKSVYNVIRQFADADGHDLWERIGNGQPPELLGYPAHEISTMDGGVIAGDTPLLFGDFSKFLIVDRVGMSVEMIPHLFGANQRPTGQRGFYAHWRNNSLVLADEAFRLLQIATS